MHESSRRSGEPGVDNGQEFTSGTRPVFVRVEGSELSLWSSRAKAPPRVPRVALWNEPSFSRARAGLTHLRQYRLEGGIVTLLPEDLPRNKRWSRRFPICVTVSNQPVVLVTSPPSPSDSAVPAAASAPPSPPHSSSVGSPPSSSTHSPSPSLDAADTCRPSSIAGTPSTPSFRIPVPAETPRPISSSTSCLTVRTTSSQWPSLGSEQRGWADLSLACAGQEDVEVQLLGTIVSEELTGLVDEEESVPQASAETSCGTSSCTTLLLFGRSARQKEEWFWRLRRAAGHPHPLDDPELLEDYASSLRHYLLEAAAKSTAEGAETAGGGGSTSTGNAAEVGGSPLDGLHYQGLNALLGRVLFDVTRSERWAEAVQSHIQRRLSALSLPAYVGKPVVSGFYCRAASVAVSRVAPPRLGADGLWVDVDVSYRGVMRFTITTRLNLANGEQPAGQDANQEADAEGEVSGERGSRMSERDCASDSAQPDRQSVSSPTPTAASEPQQKLPLRWKIFKKLAENR